MAKTKTASKKATLSKQEHAALRARVQELKAEANRANGEKAVLDVIAAMPPRERAMAKRLHEIVKTSAPSLTPKTWYGMPAYANGDGKVVCYYKGAYKFQQRYAQFGFEDAAKLDDGKMWPVVFALTELRPADEKKIASLVKKAAR